MQPTLMHDLPSDYLVAQGADALAGVAATEGGHIMAVGGGEAFLMAWCQRVPMAQGITVMCQCLWSAWYSQMMYLWTLPGWAMGPSCVQVTWYSFPPSITVAVHGASVLGLWVGPWVGPCVGGGVFLMPSCQRVPLGQSMMVTHQPVWSGRATYEQTMYL
ncbi:hypothetical protein TYRP_009565 [Tyrophagus putrescentiae]|nr:hypothetical protein TYRP_009565 [Tyrophagus putrescentiae]